MFLLIEWLGLRQRNVAALQVDVIVGMFKVLHLKASSMILPKLSPIGLLSVPFRIITQPDRILKLVASLTEPYV